MNVIRNISTREVVIEDLRVVLAAGKEIDLDRVAPRSQADASPKLRALVAQKRVTIISRDGVTPLEGVASGAAVEKLRAELESQRRERAEEAARYERLLAEQAAASARQTALMEQMLSAIKSMPTSMAGPVAAGDDGGRGTEDVSQEMAARIHAKAVARMETKVKGQIEHEQKTLDNDIGKHVDELGDLLGGGQG